MKKVYIFWYILGEGWDFGIGSEGFDDKGYEKSEFNFKGGE